MFACYTIEELYIGKSRRNRLSDIFSSASLTFYFDIHAFNGEKIDMKNKFRSETETRPMWKKCCVNAV